MRATHVIPAGRPRSGPVIDALILDFERRKGPQGSATGLKGTRVEFDLPAVRLRTDDCLVLEDGSLVEIVAKPEPLLEIRAQHVSALARIAFHLGDRHIPAEISARRLRVRDEPAVESLLNGLGVTMARIEAPFEPEGGAYARGEGDGHHHAHDRHDDDHHLLHHHHGHGHGHRRP
ncbi:MAG: urease accessory protein UreE [Pseudorhodoplanes sp.]|nr:urease accessory protein UreE [Pseudorhodoplanes sp.]